MTGKSGEPLYKSTLRRMAEEELSSLPRNVNGLDAEQQIAILEDMLARKPHIFHLVHELQVHQVEVELQNDQLWDAQEMLRRARDRYAALYNHAPVGYFSTTHRGQISEINHTGAQLLGTQQWALLQQPQQLQQFIVPDDQDIYYFHLNHLFRFMRPQTCRLRIQRPDGTQVSVRLESRLGKDEQGGTHCRTAMIDITEQVEAEEALQHANEDLEYLVQERTNELNRALEAQRFLDQVSDQLLTSLDLCTMLQRVAALVLERCADLCILLLQPPEATALSLVFHRDQAGEAEARRWLEHELATHGTQHPLLLVLQGEQPVYLGPAPCVKVLGAQVGPPDCTMAPMLAVPLIARGQTIGVLSLIREQAAHHYTPDDLHVAQELARRVGLAIDNATLHEEALQARKQAEATLQAHNQLLQLIAHDLRTPLTIMQSYTYILRRCMTGFSLPGGGQLEDSVVGIEASIAHANKHIDELLDVAALKAGQPLALRQSAIDLIGLVQRSVAACQALSQQHRLVVAVPAEPVICMGDEPRLERVLANLLTNAIKYSPQGSEVAVTVDLATRAELSGVAITVRDQGIGIPAADLPHLFEPFRRGSNTPSSVRGSGIGLASVRYIIEQHGGCIDVCSKQAVGSTFTIWLPLDGPEYAEDAELEHDAWACMA